METTSKRENECWRKICDNLRNERVEVKFHWLWDECMVGYVKDCDEFFVEISPYERTSGGGLALPLQTIKSVRPL